MAKLIGTDPNQVPTNADLGTMAYQDATDVKLESLRVEGDSGSTQARLGTSDGYLEVNSFSSNPTYVVFGGSNITQGSFGTQGNIDLSFMTNNTERMRINSAGDVDITNELTATSYNETYAAVTSSTNATIVNCEAGNAFSHTLTENTTFTFSNPPASGTAFSFSIEIIQDASASGFTVTWPASVDWPSATAPTLTATASAKDVFVFYTRDGGSNWLGFTAGQALG